MSVKRIRTLIPPAQCLFLNIRHIWININQALVLDKSFPTMNDQVQARDILDVALDPIVMC
jgi:hypothetical protein